MLKMWVKHLNETVSCNIRLKKEVFLNQYVILYIILQQHTNSTVNVLCYFKNRQLINQSHIISTNYLFYLFL